MDGFSIEECVMRAIMHGTDHLGWFFLQFGFGFPCGLRANNCRHWLCKRPSWVELGSVLTVVLWSHWVVSSVIFHGISVLCFMRVNKDLLFCLFRAMVILLCCAGGGRSTACYCVA